VIVVINQMNDWDEVTTPVGQRYRVRGGWLIDQEDASGPRGAFLASPLSRSHLAFLIGHLALKDWDAEVPTVPQWMKDPAGARTTTLRIAQSIVEFAAAHPNTHVLPVYLPADVYATADRATASPLSQFIEDLEVAPWKDQRLAEQVLTTLSALDPVDLTPALSKGTHFLEGDYHLSESGHAAVAAMITDAVAQAREKPATD
jgi:hypothetical protein